MDHNDNVQIVQGRLSVSYTFLEQWYSRPDDAVSKGRWEISHKCWVFWESVLKANDKAKRQVDKKDLPSYQELELAYNKAKATQLPYYFGRYENLKDLKYFTKKYDAHIGACLKRAAGILRFLINIKGKKDASKLGFQSKKAVYLAVLGYLKDNQNTIKGIGNGTNMRYLQQKVTDFKTNGIESITYGMVGNQNRRLVKDVTKDVLLYLAFNEFNRIPQTAQLERVYDKFIREGRELVNTTTGEAYLAKDCKSISHDAIYSLIKKNKDVRFALEYHYLTALTFQNRNLPFVHRNQPTFSLSKLTMDDKSIRFKAKGGMNVWVYFVFDMYSGAILSSPFGVDKYVQETNPKTGKKTRVKKDGKTLDLVKRAILGVFEYLHNEGYQGVVPWEIESEVHLADSLKDSSLKEEEIFPFVRFCKPRNPQEKKAEVFIKQYKYEQELHDVGGLARPFLKRLENVLNTEDTQISFSQQEIMDKTTACIDRYNNEPQKKYGGKSRMQRFKEGLQIDKMETLSYQNLAYYLGESKEVQVYRNQYVQAFADEWELPYKNTWFSKTDATNKVQVYHLPFVEDKAWIYQGDKLICEADRFTAERKAAQARIEETENNGANLGRMKHAREVVENEAKELVEQFSMKELEPIIQDNFNNKFSKKQTGLYAPDEQDDDDFTMEIIDIAS